MAVVEDDADIYERLRNIVEERDDHNHGDNPKYLQNRLREQRNLFQQLLQTIKKSEDVQVVMEKRQTNLMNENNELVEMLAAQKRNYQTLRQKCKIVQNNYSKYNKLKESYQEMAKLVQGGECIRKKMKDNITSTSNLLEKSHKSIQVSDESPQCATEKKVVEPSENFVKLTRSELGRLEDDMKALKAILQQRETTWGKLADRERLQRVQMARLNNELTNLRHVATSRQGELQLKTESLNELNTELELHRLECTQLRKQLAKMERREKDYEQFYDFNVELCLQKLQQNEEFTMRSNRTRKPSKAKSHCGSNSVMQNNV